MKELHILRIKLATILIAASLIFGSSVTMGELFSSVIVSQGAEKSFSIKDIPQYSGAPSVEVNGNEPYFTTKERQNNGHLNRITNWIRRDAVGLRMQMFLRIPCRLLNEGRLA